MLYVLGKVSTCNKEITVAARGNWSRLKYTLGTLNLMYQSVTTKKLSLFPHRHQSDSNLAWKMTIVIRKFQSDWWLWEKKIIFITDILKLSVEACSFIFQVIHCLCLFSMYSCG